VGQHGDRRLDYGLDADQIGPPLVLDRRDHHQQLHHAKHRPEMILEFVQRLSLAVRPSAGRLLRRDGRLQVQ
jgi:hypothetical protein